MKNLKQIVDLLRRFDQLGPAHLEGSTVKRSAEGVDHHRSWDARSRPKMVCQASSGRARTSSGRVVTEYWSQLSDSSDSCSLYGTILHTWPICSSYLCHS